MFVTHRVVIFFDYELEISKVKNWVNSDSLEDLTNIF